MAYNANGPSEDEDFDIVSSFEEELREADSQADSEVDSNPQATPVAIKRAPPRRGVRTDSMFAASTGSQNSSVTVTANDTSPPESPSKAPVVRSEGDSGQSIQVAKPQSQFQPQPRHAQTAPKQEQAAPTPSTPPTPRPIDPTLPARPLAPNEFRRPPQSVRPAGLPRDQFRSPGAPPMRPVSSEATPNQPKSPATPFVPAPEAPRRKGGFFRLFIEILLIAAIAALGWYAWTLRSDKQDLQSQVSSLKNDPQAAVQKQTDQIIAAVGQLMQVPTDETPTVANVADAAQAQKQSTFFAKAQNGDKVLMYVKAQEAILYRPSTNKVILVAPLTFTPQSATSGTTTNTSTTKSNTTGSTNATNSTTDTTKTPTSTTNNSTTTTPHN